MIREAVAALLLLSAGSGLAADDVGIPVTVQVVDQEGNAIPTAVIRHPNEEHRHRVNTETGKWVGSVLYMPDGSEVAFEKGMEVEFEVSAPGYSNMRVVYEVRKRKNLLVVTLQKMSFDVEDDDEEEPVIDFKRDRPID